MRAGFSKSIRLVVALATLFLVLAPVSVVAAPLTTTESCDSTPCQDAAANSLCCLISCSLSQCSLTGALGDEVLFPGSVTNVQRLYVAVNTKGLTSQCSIDKPKTFQSVFLQESLFDITIEYHCRNCLISEEPPQL